MLRSIYSIARYTPAYSISNTKDKDYEFEYRLFVNVKNQNMFTFGKKNKAVSNIKIENCDLVNISISNEYICKDEIMRLEKVFYKNQIEKMTSLSNQQRQRCLSLNNPLIEPLFEVITYDDIYSNTPNAEITVKPKLDTYLIDKNALTSKKILNENIRLNMSSVPQSNKQGDTNEGYISFQTHNDNKKESQSESNFSIDFSSLKQSIVISNTINELNESKKQSLNNNDSKDSLKKLMKTSDTDSSDESSISFKLNCEENRSINQTAKDNNSGTIFIINKTINNSTPNTEIILSNFNTLKKKFKKRATIINCINISKLYMMFQRYTY